MRCFGWTLAIAGTATSVLAQTPPPAPAPAPAAQQQGVVSYPASFFASHQPTTAIDMVLLLPGFAFDNGAGQVRGLADAAGNVLIDGERPVTKQDSLFAILRRIPANQVERIDLIRGGAPGIDMQGRSVLANVVRKKNTGLTGAVAESNILNLQDGRYVPYARVEFAKRDDGRTLEGSLGIGEAIYGDAGAGPHDQFSPNGQPTSIAELHAKDGGRSAQATLSYETPLLGGKFRLNVAGGAFRDLDQEADTSLNPADADQYRDRFLLDRGELGLHYSRDFGPKTTLEVMAIQQLRRSSETSHYQALGDDELFAETNALAESILRTTLRYRLDPKLSIELTAEGAYNIQDTSTVYTVNGLPTALPAQDVKVEERRTEESATVTWNPSSKLTFETGLRLEASTISAAGDVVQSRTFVYPKPRAILTWTPDAPDQVRLHVERVVGQLDFASFAANGSLNVGGVRAGNPSLLPQDVWLSELAVERKFWTRGDLILTLRHSEIADAVDRIQIDGYDEAGNVGHAREDELRLDLALPLDRLLIPNGLIRASGTWRQTEVVDPTTGQSRSLSNVLPFEGEAHFSQDLTGWRSTWGVDAQFGQIQTVWRFDEIDVYKQGTWLRPFYEYKPTANLSLRLEVPNALNRSLERVLTEYDGPRGSGVAPDLIDYRKEYPGRLLYFRVRQAF